MVIGSTPSSSGQSDLPTEEGVEVVLDPEQTFSGVWEAFARGDRAALATYQVRQEELDKAELECIAFSRRMTDPTTGTLNVDTPSERKNIVKAWLSTQIQGVRPDLIELEVDVYNAYRMQRSG